MDALALFTTHEISIQTGDWFELWGGRAQL
jgi:hypothetical protein